MPGYGTLPPNLAYLLVFCFIPVIFQGGPPVTMRLVEAVAAHLMIFDLEEHCSFKAHVPSSRYIQCSLSLSLSGAIFVVYT